jgi:uncharacterized protein (DUF885 family)
MRATFLLRSATVIAAILTFSSSQVSADAPSARDEAEVHSLFDDYWQWRLREYPEDATAIGDHRYDDRLSDQSTEAVKRRSMERARYIERALAVDTTKLSAEDRVSLRVLLYVLGQAAARDKLCAPLSCSFGDFWSPVTQFYGPQFDLPQLVDATRFATVGDYEAYLKRLSQYPLQLEQLVARMESGMALGWMPAKIAISRVPEQIDGQLDPDPTKSPEFKPFLNFPADISATDRARLTEVAKRTISEKIIPAFQRLRDFYDKRYLPGASNSIAASDLPPGGKYYGAMLEVFTTTHMSAQEIHALGLAEVARISKEMDATVIAAGFNGTRAEFQKHINSAPEFFYTHADDMLAGYRDIAKRADAELPRFFEELPRLTYGVRAMRPEEGDNADHYVDGAADGSRAGFFEANVNSLSHQPKWEMETTLLHEAVPGHHLQVSRAQELKNLAEFRRHAFFASYIEGWALYAESLGYEMGFYKDPFSRFGNLSAEMLRAARLVVDTGIHSLGWARERAIDYLVDNAALNRDLATAEVDRYIVLPGQATAYKIGQLKIKTLRAMAKDKLGDKFDLRRFHNALLDNGALPLDVLEEQMNRWVENERTGASVRP